MPIGQLLASISGEKATTSSALPPVRLPKRKADDDTAVSGSKLQRTTTPTSTYTGSARPAPDSSKSSRPAERSSTGYAGSARPSTTTSSAPRPLTEKSSASASKKPALTSNGKPSPTTASFGSASRSGSYSTSLPTKRPIGSSAPPTATSQSANSDSSKAPKKGSIAEIRARAAAQQEKLQAIGKIQHKATEKPLTKKEREEAAAEELRLQKKGFKSGVKPGVGPLSKNGSNGLQRNGNGHVDRERGAVQKASASGRPGKSTPIEEPKRKKAAMATTGYTGSARPVAANKAKPGVAKPGSSSKGRDQDRERRPNPMGMFSKPRRRHEDDYDEEMDDFVVDDEEEEDDGYGYGSRYRYADEDDDSDMEAGFSDVEDEEAAATRQAILDDKREQQLEEQHRREKEARKRKFLAGRR